MPANKLPQPSISRSRGLRQLEEYSMLEPPSEERAFHAAIWDRVEDSLRWLVYADWLDEAGRSREAERIRRFAAKLPNWVVLTNVLHYQVIALRRDCEICEDMFRMEVWVLTASANFGQSRLLDMSRNDVEKNRWLGTGFNSPTRVNYEILRRT